MDSLSIALLLTRQEHPKISGRAHTNNRSAVLAVTLEGGNGGAGAHASLQVHADPSR